MAVDVSEGPAESKGTAEEGVREPSSAAGGWQDACCELHGAEAAEEVRRSEQEASCLELAAGSKVQLREGAALWIDGSGGIEPAAGHAEASALVEAGGRIELYGLGELGLSGPAALMPAPPRRLAQVVCS